MFKNTPSEAFEPERESCHGPLVESVQVSAAEEDLAQSTDVSVKLGDFGTGELLNTGL